MNQPCIDLRTTLCYITPQNHGYAVDNDTLPKGWKPMFMNANDYSNEGIIHSFKPFFSVQFHPEAMGGPHDAEFLFDMFLDRVKTKTAIVETVCLAPPAPIVEKVLLLGSGGLSIGQAGEFDYSGSQAIKALKEENIEVVLINPNIATVQTSSGMADKTYFYPVTVEMVEKVIQKEKPDSILLQFGGQTALNCGVQLKNQGILDKYNVRVLGTQIDVIESTEDREVFAQKLAEIKEHVAPSFTAETVEDAMEAARKIGYPVLVRAAYALGGLGSGFAKDEVEMRELVTKALNKSTQVIIDKCLRGWKEVEYEVVRDAKGNCITVCNMENFDPLGIHTGDSIVIAPSQTLSNREYYKLREVAIKVVRHLGVVGECNIQYALDPYSEEYCIIEVNARLSRSSALASKATGYPLAYVACKLALGIPLTDVKNAVTKTTSACFEPALDYLVVKVPRWDMRKFSHVSSKIGTAMKSVGEVMAIGRTFEETFSKALRMIDGAIDGFGDNNSSYSELFDPAQTSVEVLDDLLENPSDIRIYAIGAAFHRGYTVDRLWELTRIDKWFLGKLQNIKNIETALQAHDSVDDVSVNAMKHAKRYGLSDKQIGRCLGMPRKTCELVVRAARKRLGITPWVKQIDTLAAEFPAQTNYLYMTYVGDEHDLDFEDKGVMVLGCGAYRIGSSCEFDWCAVSCMRTLKAQGYKGVMVNYNPETVSTDFDECDRLYFEELSFERVLDIYEVEQSSGVVVSVGGQIPNNLAIPLSAQGVNVLGTSPESIDNAEDRAKFSALLDRLNVDQPLWEELNSIDEAKDFADRVGYPVLVRPSYVLSGAAMNVAANADALLNYLQQATDLSSDHPVVISKFVLNAKEVEFDGVAKNGEIINYAISEHVENAGVHSGDATLVLPAQKLYVETVKRVKKIAKKIAAALNITGPFNVQFLSKNNEIKVIECNLRSSRSFPFVSKTFNVNFVEQATKAMIGAPVKPRSIDLSDVDHVCMKCPMFSFSRLQGADPVLRVEMASTGEVACFGSTRQEAYLLGLLSTGFKLPEKSVLLSIGPIKAKLEFTESLHTLIEMGYKLYGTPGTVAHYKEKLGIEIELLHKPSSGLHPNSIDFLREGKIDLVINVPQSPDDQALTEGYHVRRTAVDFSVSLLSNIKCATIFVKAMKMFKDPDFDFQVKHWREFMNEARLL